MRAVPAVIVLLLLAACTSPAETSTTVTARDLPVGSTAPTSGGEAAPDFVVPLRDGGEFSLTRHVVEDGRPVLLNLWASWCLPCREEMPAIDAAAARHPGVLFLGVSVQDGRDAAEAFAEEVDVAYPIGFDVDGSVDGRYRPLGLPATYIVSGDGVLLEEFYGRLTDEVIDQKISLWFGG